MPKVGLLLSPQKMSLVLSQWTRFVSVLRSRIGKYIQRLY